MTDVLEKRELGDRDIKKTELKETGVAGIEISQI